MRKKKLFVYICLVLLGTFIGTSYGQTSSVIVTEEAVMQEYYLAFNEATKYYLFGNYVQAVSLYRECLKIKPASGAIHFQLAKIFLGTGNVPVAREHAKKAAYFSPDNKWYLQTLGDIFKMEQKYDSAVYVYLALNKIDKKNVSLLYEIASVYQLAGKLDMAIQYLDQVDVVIGVSKEVSLSRYRIYDQLNKESEAIMALNMAYGLSDREYSIAGMMAEFYRSHNKPDSAYKYYNLIYPRYKADAMVSYSYGEFLLEQGREDSARHVLGLVMQDTSIELMTKAGYFYKILQDEKLFDLYRSVLLDVVEKFYNTHYLDIRSASIYADVNGRFRSYQRASVALVRIVDNDKANYLALEQLIYILNMLGKTDSVLYFSETGIRNFANRPVSYLFNGSVKLQRLSFTDALAVLERGIKMADSDALKLEFFILIAECYQNLKMFQESADAFELALKIDPENLPVLNNYAYYLALQNRDLVNAERMSSLTIRREPESSTYLDTYSWVLYKMGKLSKANKFIKMALKFGGTDNAEILSHEADILYALGKYEEAVESLKKLLVISDDSARATVIERIALYQAKGKKL